MQSGAYPTGVAKTLIMQTTSQHAQGPRVKMAAVVTAGALLRADPSVAFPERRGSGTVRQVPEAMSAWNMEEEVTSSSVGKSDWRRVLQDGDVIGIMRSFRV